jgi:hypothetical protein
LIATKTKVVLAATAVLGVSIAVGSILGGTAFGGTARAAISAAPANCFTANGGLAAAGQTKSWRIIQSTKPSAVGSLLVADAAVGPSDVWAFGDCLNGRGGGTAAAVHYNGSRWTAVPLPAGTLSSVVAAAGSSPSDVWAFAGSGRTEQALFFNGRAWTDAGRFKMLGNSFFSAAALGRHDVWAFSAASMSHYNGRSWSESTLPFDMTAVSALPGGNVWATGFANGQPVVAHWRGAWTITPMSRYLPGSTGELCVRSIPAIYAQSRGSVWAVGEFNCQDNGGQIHVILHWNGSSWAVLPYHGRTGQATSIAPDGVGGLWISTVRGVPGTSGMLHLTGGRVVSSALPSIDGTTPRVTLTAAPSGGPAVGLGSYVVNPGNENIVGSVIIEQR